MPCPISAFVDALLPAAVAGRRACKRSHRRSRSVGIEDSGSCRKEPQRRVPPFRHFLC